MPKITVMTFNVENMLYRFDFSKSEEEGMVSIPDTDDPAARAELIRNYWNVLNDEDRVFTALTMKEGDPDVICLMEVENMSALEKFHDGYLRRFSGRDYRYQYLIHGNDKRGINVAVLSRVKIESVASHQNATAPGSSKRVFKRDCLEVRLEKNNKTIPIFVCHFKSMMGGRKETRPDREAESAAVVKIINDKYDDPAKSDWLIVGDLNDYTEVDGKPDKEHGLGPLLDGKFCVDLVKRISDPKDRWTHFYASAGDYHQLDYMLASPSLAKKNSGVIPKIIRNGQPYRAERYTGPRWPRIGYDRPKASDHCPVVATLEF